MVGNVKVGKSAVRVVFLGLAILILLNILARFNILDLTASSANIITIIGALFLLAEVGIMSLIRSGVPSKAGVVINWLIAIVALLALVASGLGLVNVTLEILSPIQGIVDVGL